MLKIKKVGTCALCGKVKLLVLRHVSYTPRERICRRCNRQMGKRPTASELQITLSAIGYQKIYKLRQATPSINTIGVTFPYGVVEREARKHGMSTPDFIACFRVIARYGDFDGVVYTFEAIPESLEKK